MIISLWTFDKSPPEYNFELLGIHGSDDFYKLV